MRPAKLSGSPTPPGRIRIIMKSSLSLLLPSQQYPEHASSPSQACDQKFPRSSATNELEKLTRTVIDGINSQSYRAIQNMMAKSYKADLDDITQSSSYDENETQFRQLSTKNPEYRVEVVNVEADVDEDGQYAIGEF